MRVAPLLAVLYIGVCTSSGSAQESELPNADSAAPLDGEAASRLLERIETLESELEQIRERLPVDADGEAENPEQVPKVEALDTPQTSELISTAFQRELLDQGGLLLAARTFEFDSSVSFVSSSNERIIVDGITISDVVVVGDIVSERVHRDTATIALSMRAGLPWDSQFELRFPYSYEASRTVTADNKEERIYGEGKGDAQLTVSHQFVRGRGPVPEMLASLRYKSTTGNDPYRVDPDELIFGTGFESLQLSTTFVKAADPAVFFGGISYTARRKSTKPVGTVAPGASHAFQLGLALALNLNTSLSFGLEQGYTRRTELNGDSVPGSTLRTGGFSFGVAHIFNRKVSLDVGVNIGLTEDSADSQVTFALPVRVLF